jgi:hypothetical protein
VTEYERNIRKGLSAVRRVYRRADTLGERLERILKRLYLRKTVPKTRAEVETLVQAYYQYRDQVKALETSLASDFVGYVEPSKP